MIPDKDAKIQVNDWAHYASASEVDAVQKKQAVRNKNWIWLSAILGICVFVLFSIINGGPTPVEEMARAAEKAQFPAPAYPFPEIGSHAFFVKILGKNVVLAKQREWIAMPPASLTKLLTAVLAYENLPVSSRLAFSPEAIKVEEKVSGVRPGESFNMEDVVALIIIYSANDSALAIAEAAGSASGQSGFADRISFFTELMNRKAAELGLKNSHFDNPSGLDSEDHFSTAEDLAILAEYIWYSHPRIFALSRILETTLISGLSREYRIKNTDELLGEFPAILGGKTGFTDNAKGALILLYPVRTGDAAVIVILGSDDRFGDGRKIIQWLEKSF